MSLEQGGAIRTLRDVFEVLRTVAESTSNVGHSHAHLFSLLRWRARHLAFAILWPIDGEPRVAPPFKLSRRLVSATTLDCHRSGTFAVTAGLFSDAAWDNFAVPGNTIPSPLPPSK